MEGRKRKGREGDEGEREEERKVLCLQLSFLPLSHAGFSATLDVHVTLNSLTYNGLHTQPLHTHNVSLPLFFLPLSLPFFHSDTVCVCLVCVYVYVCVCMCVCVSPL